MRWVEHGTPTTEGADLALTVNGLCLTVGSGDVLVRLRPAAWAIA